MDMAKEGAQRATPPRASVAPALGGMGGSLSPNAFSTSPFEIKDLRKTFPEAFPAFPPLISLKNF
jgi:hypothetical protein